MIPTKYDLAIIGSGGGVFTAAIRANTLGKLVMMIEHETLGGTCVNTGYVPSRALIATAGVQRVAIDAIIQFPGIVTTADPVDMPVLATGKQTLAESLRGGKYADVADSYDWQILRGDASFVDTPDAPAFDVAGSDGSVEAIRAHHYLVATSSRPWVPPIGGLEKTGYLASTTAMELTEVLESLLVLGDGYIVLKQAQLFVHLGSQVTLLVRSRLASREEPEVSKALQEMFADEDIHVVSHAAPTRVSRGTGGKAVVTAASSGGSQEFHTNQVLVAFGRRPITDGLNLDAVEVNTGDFGEVVVSDRLQPPSPRVWTAGDITGYPEFVYVATHHDALVVENAFANADRPVDYARLPRVTFAGPVIGVVGMTEKDALAAGVRCDCRVLPLHHVLYALVNRDTHGFIKIVVNTETEEVLGLTTVAKDARELAAAGVHVFNRIVAEVVNAWTPYLAMAEDIRIAAKAFITDPSLLLCCT